MKTAQQEQRELRMHHNLLFDVIFKQAGSREKGVLEGIMNSIDAGATKIDVKLDSEGVTIEDDGRGFPTREEIVANFECFGTPHQEGDAVYGRFRMGRGQLFAFGYNTWRSRTFEMRVDAKTSLTYDLKSKLDDRAGCSVVVVWYDTMYPYEVDSTVRNLTRWVKYVDVPVFINGTQANTPPKDDKWDFVTDTAYIRLKERGGVEVYNLGVFVRDYPGYQFGTGGVVVSRKRLDVNFARNDVQSTCPVWKAAQKLLKGDLKQKAAKRVNRTLPDDEMQFWLESIKHKEVPEGGELRKLRLFTDVAGRKWAHDEIVAEMRKHGVGRVTVADIGDAQGDRLHNGRQAFVFARETLDQMDVRNLDCFLEKLGGVGLTFPAANVPLAEAVKTLGRLEQLPKSAWTRRERAILKNLAQADYPLRRMRETLHGYQAEEREFKIGVATDAAAWTDGQTYIVLERGYLKQLTLAESGWMNLAFIILHEYLHTDSNELVHNHTPEFYRVFHDEQHLAVELGLELMMEWRSTLASENIKATSYATKIIDRSMRRLHAENAFEECDALVKRAESLKQDLSECAARVRKQKKSNY